MFNEATILIYFTQICLGIQYLHHNNLVHKELRPKSIYLDDQHASVDYLGSEDLIPILRRNTSLVMRYPIYDAPKNVDGEEYTLKSNIWSLGIILYELCAFSHPFKAPTNVEVDRNILIGSYPHFRKFFLLRSLI